MAAGNKNLRPFTSKTAKAAGKKGGVASGKTRRSRKTMRELLKSLLELPLKDPKNDPLVQLDCLAQAKGANLTVEEGVLIMQIQKALTGSTQAACFLRDTAGEQLKAANNNTEEEAVIADDGFVKAVKRSAKNIWSDADGDKKTKATNKAKHKV